jgi:hypothetical protein
VINPTNVMLTPEEVVFVTKDCGAKVLLASSDKSTPIIGRRSDTPLEHLVIFLDRGYWPARLHDLATSPSAGGACREATDQRRLVAPNTCPADGCQGSARAASVNATISWRSIAAPRARNASVSGIGSTS